MTWWGKVVGGAIGLAVGGPIGGLIGVAAGHQVDRGFAEALDGRSTVDSQAESQRIQAVFFATTFSVMGHLAKADGRVSENEIRAARAVMDRMNLTPAQVQGAIRLFTDGKRADFPLERALDRFDRDCGHRRDLLRTFVEIQLQSILGAGSVHPVHRELIWKICTQLGISRVELAQIEALARAQWAHDGRKATAARGVDDIRQAYAVLGVGRNVPDAEVKTAYRRLMSQYHPDKLVAKGLPESMMQVAQERIREIRAAYDAIKAERRMR